MTTTPDLTDAHRGRLFKDRRWYCVCGWTSERGLTRDGALASAVTHRAQTDDLTTEHNRTP